MNCFVLTVVVASTILPVFAQASTGCPLSGADEKFLIQRRLQGLRASLLAQLGLKNTNFTATNRTVSKEQMDSYTALTQAADSIAEEKQRQCQSEEVFAQPITTIVGRLNEHDAHLSQRGKRHSVDSFERNVLDVVDLEFDFVLKDSLTSITRSELLLYQFAASRKDNVQDKIQYVEIKAVFDYIGLKTVVAAKNIDIYNEGFQAIDITPAVKLWIERQINGTVRLEITISCLSSKKCSQYDHIANAPASLKFDLTTSSRKPRLVILSQNPIEVENRNRFRRQSSETQGAGVSYCVENQSTCCVKNLTIDFIEDLNFHFVLFPRTFEANYCEGMCPITPGGDLMTPELYSFISKLTNNPASTSIKPCCAGNKFKPLVIIMMDPENPAGTIIEELQQVTVESCRCA